MLGKKFITMTVAAASRDGLPVVDVIDGGRDLRIWPTGRAGALITMSVTDWQVLSAAVQAAIAGVAA